MRRLTQLLLFFVVVLLFPPSPSLSTQPSVRRLKPFPLPWKYLLFVCVVSFPLLFRCAFFIYRKRLICDFFVSTPATIHGCGADTPEIRLATPYFKPGNNQTDRVPDYFLHQTEAWLVFPHELIGLTVEEMLDHKPELAALIDELGQQL